MRTFSGSSHFVLDFLIEEVFERLPADEQDFLLKTSILDRFSGPLCDAVTNRSDSGSMLDRLEHTNLFVIPMDASRAWYRYHHLFAELLQQRLYASDPLAAQALHGLAGRWFAAQTSPCPRSKWMAECRSLCSRPP